MIIDDLFQRLYPRAEARTVSDVRIGLGYTAVRLDNGACGLAYTFREDADEGCCALREGGTIAGRGAAELAGWVRSPDAISAAIGLATLNALIEPPPQVVEGDVGKLLCVNPEDVAGMIGYFGPLVDGLRKSAKTLHIFERDRRDEPGLLPDSAAPAILPECQVVLISATTLINRTIEPLLELARNARELAILGPSTPLLPEVFVGHGVTLLSGVQVTDADRVLQVVSEGGGTRQFGRAVKKLAIRMGK